MGVRILAHPYFYAFQTIDNQSRLGYNINIKSGQIVRY